MPPIIMSRRLDCACDGDLALADKSSTDPSRADTCGPVVGAADILVVEVAARARRRPPPRPGGGGLLALLALDDVDAEL